MPKNAAGSLEADLRPGTMSQASIGQGCGKPAARGCWNRNYAGTETDQSLSADRMMLPDLEQRICTVFLCWHTATECEFAIQDMVGGGRARISRMRV